MSEDYNIPLEEFSLEEYQVFLESARVLPGRQILKENIPENFEVFRSSSISNLKELLAKVKNKKEIKKFSKVTGLSEEYLIILRRQLRSLMSKPVYLKDFPEVNQELVEKLEEIGVKNSKQLYMGCKTPKERKELAEKIDMAPESLMELVKLSDLARCGGVGPLFARMIYQTGVDTIEELARASAEDLLTDLKVLNEERGYTKAKFVTEDVRYCIQYAKMLPKAILY
jgi:hypothetical protein